MQVLISVPDQKLALVCDGELVARFPVSTSRFGTGDNFGSYKTPLGELRVCDKIGQDLSPGAVIHHREATGEVLPVNAPGRDPIVTRVIWLDGLEAQNHNARSRGIYIHGTPEERTLGTPSSYGCIRMRSKDVIKVFEEVPVGTLVSIIPERLPHMHRYRAPKDEPAPEPPPEEIASGPAPSPSAPMPSASPVSEPSPAKSESRIADSRKHEIVTPSYTDRETSSALRAMKGSILLANLPGAGEEKPDEHHASKGAAAAP
ncbi:MAG TPA: L,D-transpeptidase [Chthoniobacteraceae bacterium]|jgi:hypothetical protein|nr:L,D-transpeptidase [Chthoniobacteraceae bacterium]